MSINNYKNAFIQIAIQHEVLSFGEFTLKSGRVSPYFFNAGRFHTGSAMAALGHYYAQALVDADVSIDMLFGPAYKGIPLVTALAIALAERHGKDYPIVYNRKEVKNHGEGGVLVGAPLNGRILIVDDVITAGTAIREVMAIIDQAGSETAAVIVGLDRQERGKGGLSAIQELEQQHGIPVISLIGFNDIITYVESSIESKQHLPSMLEYRKRYGV